MHQIDAVCSRLNLAFILRLQMVNNRRLNRFCQPCSGGMIHRIKHLCSTILWVLKMVGFDTNPTQEIRDNPITGSNFDWQEDPTQDSWTIYDAGAYPGIGGRFRIGFDSISFFQEFDRIFS